MKRPLLLIVALVAFATTVSLLVLQVSRPPADAGETSAAFAPARETPDVRVADAGDAPAASTDLAAPSR